MALAISNLTSGRPNNVSSFTTNSISPPNGSIVLIAIGSRIDGGTGGNIPTISSGLSLTWTQLATQNDPGGGQGVRMTIYWALVSGSPTGAISVSFGGQTQTDSNYSIEQITGANIGGAGANAFGTPVGGNTASGGSQSLSLAAFKNAKDIAYGAFYNAGGGATVGSGFTQLVNVAGNGQMMTEYKVNSTTVNYSYTGSNDSAGIAVELVTQNSTGLIGDI